MSNKNVMLEKIGNVIELQRGYDLPTDKRIPGDIPIISSSGYTGYHNAYKCDGENVVTGRCGTIGEVYYHNGRCWPLNTSLFVKDFKGNSPRYIYYFLKNALCLYKVSGSDKSTVPGIDRKVIHDMRVPFYKDIYYQSALCDVLDSIDKKIRCNQMILIELEAMAKTLYDYWFVQFDFPNENGKPYRTSGGEMVWNEQLKREIPKGWEAGTIGDLGTIVSGGTPNTSCDEYYCTDGYAWITPNDLSRSTDKMFISHGERDVTVEGIENSSAVLMPKHTVLLSTRAPIGYLAISENEVCTNQGFKSIVPDARYSEFYIYYVLKSNIPAIAQQGVGTTFKEVSKETLSEFKIPLPPIELTERFAAHILANCTKRKLLENECKELTKLRDWLLPMLMNGQARAE